MFVSVSASFLAYANLKCSKFSPEEGSFLAIPSNKTLLGTNLCRAATVLTRFSAAWTPVLVQIILHVVIISYFYTATINETR